VKPRVYVDSDGVLANFNKAFAPAFGLTYPSRTVLHHEWLMNTAGVSVSEFFRIVETHSYLWENAEPYPWTSEMVQVLDLAVPDWMILTSATHDPDCWSGKVKWFKRYLTDSLIDRVVMIGGRKHRIASKGDLLIDDHYENIEAWRAAGGVAIHWIDYTDDLEELARKQIEQLTQVLDNYSVTADQAFA
jgi:5'(3')-deoxyribonucleotidase